MAGFEDLRDGQRTLLERWLPGAVVEQDHSWGQVDRLVLEVVHAGRRYIVKAGGPEDHHMAREIEAHRTWLEPLTSVGRAPLLAQADDESHLLVTHHLPGRLVLDSDEVGSPDTYRQAGRLLALLHGQQSAVDDGLEAQENARSLAWLDRAHRIDAMTEQRLRAELASWPTPTSVVVPTHGDWQPRNWLTHEGVVSVIDFGRVALRPAMSDLTRLAAQQFRGHPELETAFVEGYGHDPREPGAWYRTRLREAVNTAAWAHAVGDDAFEAQGLRMISDALSSP